ncbi:MAG: Bax inhibitor-1/YccA family protein [Sphingobacteriales bacterium JAD_PAG50586_3]|nr:MAG: Bax inhibitor-1/YccA family protein [Sphingobacteriales bacterium JAD_PAG50586_3]
MSNMPKSSSPVLSEKIFERAANNFTESGQTMTINGTVNKTFILLLILLSTAIFTWTRYNELLNPSEIMGYVIGGAIVALIIAIVYMFKPNWGMVLAPAYAAAEGLFIGGISAMFNSMADGIVMQAVILTFGVLFVMLAMYKFRIIKVTEKLKSGIMAATGAVALFYLVMWVMRLFGGDTSFYAGNSMLSIGISLLIVGIAAFNLLLDFAFIEEGSQRNAPKYMEWFGAFGILVTLVWLYIEILRLLSKLRD